MFVQKVIQLKQKTEEHSPLNKICYLTGQERVKVSSYKLYRQIYHQWTQRNHLRYVITWVNLATLYKEYGIGLWMVPFYHLSLTCRRSIPHRRAHKKGRNSNPRTFVVSFNNLCRKYREHDLHCINKKTGIPTLFQKNRLYCFTRSSGLFPQASSGTNGSR